ncbi:MAG: acetate--CoA ligase family protein, partial [Candidatus Paceibacteria bacterium]
PITKPRIWKLLKQTNVYRILKGARGTVYDAQFLVDTIYNIHLFAISFEQKITEIDVNPIIVQEEGGYVVDMKVYIKQ